MSLQTLDKNLLFVNENTKEFHSASDPPLVEALNEVDQRYRAEVEPLLKENDNVQFERYPADSALDLCRLAQKVDADLIVLGCHQKPNKASGK